MAENNIRSFLVNTNTKPSLQIPPYYDAEYGSDYNDLDFFLDDDFARRSLIGGKC